MHVSVQRAGWPLMSHKPGLGSSWLNRAACLSLSWGADSSGAELQDRSLERWTSEQPREGMQMEQTKALWLSRRPALSTHSLNQPESLRPSETGAHRTAHPKPGRQPWLCHWLQVLHPWKQHANQQPPTVFQGSGPPDSPSHICPRDFTTNGVHPEHWRACWNCSPGLTTFFCYFGMITDLREESLGKPPSKFWAPKVPPEFPPCEAFSRPGMCDRRNPKGQPALLLPGEEAGPVLHSPIFCGLWSFTW